MVLIEKFLAKPVGRITIYLFKLDPYTALLNILHSSVIKSLDGSKLPNIAHSLLLNNKILKFTSPVLLNLMGNIVP